ncbi:MAG: CPBP family intramembrane metalloprotease [Gammaproteobacteria bacterium]|nr:MAG: CPBP family intramembrane metalloprotease [Gammaproteobacteria bacterium]
MKTLAGLRQGLWPRLLLFALLLVAASGLHRAALWQYDHLLGERALHDLSLRLQQGTPFYWPMRAAHELDGEVHGLGDHQFHKGALRFESTNGDSHFSLALADRLIDHRYNRLEIRLTASQPTRLQVFHRVMETDDFVFGSQWVEVAEGEQVLTLALDRMQWYAVAITDRGQQSTKPDARWGGERGVITELRIDPANQAGLKMKISNIALTPDVPWPVMQATDIQLADGLPADPLASTIVVLDARQFAGQLDWLRDHRDAPLVLADGTAMRTPELGLQLRNRVLHEVPQAVWFPAVPDATMLARIHALGALEAPYPDAHWFWSDYRQPAAIIALLLSLLFGLCLMNPAGWLRVALAAQVLLLSLMALCVWINARHLDSITGVVSVLVLLGTGVAWGMTQGGRWQDRLGLVAPSWLAWRDAMLLTLPALLLLAGISWWGGRWQQVSWEAIAGNFWMYPFWVVVQQAFLSCWLATMLGRLFATDAQPQWLPVAGGIAGFAFALLHFPNYGAMLTVLFMGTGWACLWLRHRSIWPLVMSHVLLGAMFRVLMPVEFRVDGDVGLMYFAWLWY